MDEITITNVLKINNETYQVAFSSNFTLNTLKVETSANGNNWNTPIALSGTTSPKTFNTNLKNFFVRIHNEETLAPRKHNNKFNLKFN